MCPIGHPDHVSVWPNTDKGLYVTVTLVCMCLVHGNHRGSPSHTSITTINSSCVFGQLSVLLGNSHCSIFPCICQRLSRADCLGQLHPLPQQWWAHWFAAPAIRQRGTHICCCASTTPRSMSYIPVWMRACTTPCWPFPNNVINSIVLQGQNSFLLASCYYCLKPAWTIIGTKMLRTTVMYSHKDSGLWGCVALPSNWCCEKFACLTSLQLRPFDTPRDQRPAIIALLQVAWWYRLTYWNIGRQH